MISRSSPPAIPLAVEHVVVDPWNEREQDSKSESKAPNVLQSYTMDGEIEFDAIASGCACRLALASRAR